MAVVTLDISEFRTLYPQFADSVTYTDAEITAQFDIACTLINNTEQSYIPYIPPRIVMRKRVLYAPYVIYSHYQVRVPNRQETSHQLLRVACPLASLLLKVIHIRHSGGVRQNAGSWYGCY
jgi:hypothetical protein